MLSKSQLAKFLVGLAEVNDTDLVTDDGILSQEICAPHDRAAVRQLAELIRNLHGEYSYLESPEFRTLISGKSDAYCDMLRKRSSTPMNNARTRKTYAEALGAILADDRAYELTPQERHETLDNVRRGFAELANPSTNC